MKAFCIFLLLVLGSCTITKRLHNPGYNISWKKHFQKNDKSDFTAETKDQPEISKPQEPLDNSSLIIEKPDSQNQVVIEEHVLEKINSDIKIPTTSDDSLKKKTKDKFNFPHFKFIPKIDRTIVSKRKIPLALGIPLAYITLGIGSMLIALVVFFLVITIDGLFFSSIISWAVIILITIGLTGLLLFLIFHIFDRKDLRYESEKERNKAYWIYIAMILIIPLLLLVNLGITALIG